MRERESQEEESGNGMVTVFLQGVAVVFSKDKLLQLVTDY